MSSRNYAIDIARMLAAIDVMLGHFKHIKHANLNNFTHLNTLSNTLSLGGFSVALFFGLSGIALKYQTLKFGGGFKWLKGRLLRLMPMYWITLVLPIFGYLILGYHLNYSTLGYVLAFLGLNSLSNSPLIGIPPINNPLWTLSVEIILSSSILLLNRLKGISLYLIFAVSIMMPILGFWNGILEALPIFIAGYLLPNFKLNILRNSKFAYVFLVFALIVIFVFPQTLLGSIHNQIASYEFQCFVVLSLLIYLYVKPVVKRNFIGEISQRSYALYAVHFPVLLFTNKLIFKSNLNLSWTQIGFTLILVLFATETAHRLIDVPAINYSRKYLIAGSK